MEYWLRPLGGRGVELTQERHEALSAARLLLSLCSEISLALDVFARAITAFEATLYNRTFAFGFTPENLDGQDYADEARPEISLHVMTVLTAFRAYVDGVPHLLDKLQHPEKSSLRAAFDVAVADCRTNSFDFVLCWELRNAAVHRRPLVDGWVAGMRNEFKDGRPSLETPSLRTFTLDIRMSLDQIIEEMRGNKALKAKLISMRDDQRIEWIDLKYVIRQLASVIVRLHLSFGETLLPKVEAAFAFAQNEIETASRELDDVHQMWLLEVTDAARPMAFKLSTLSALAGQFIQWKRLSNLADSVVHLEVVRHEATYPLDTQNLWRRGQG